MKSITSPVATLVTLAAAALAADYSLDSDASIKKTAGGIASGLVKYYHGNESGEIPGILPGPPPAGDYYWGDAGALWQSLIEYWHYTGDSTYNGLVKQALLAQKGAEYNNFLPMNFTATMGNDDQGLWASAAMMAAERGFPDPEDGDLEWVDLVDSVFNQFVTRWDAKTCGGGLRWQIPFSNLGYDYKNSFASGYLFNLAARLASYTGNQTYADWAAKTWDWMEEVGLISDDYSVYDGARATDNCKKINKVEFSLNNGILTHGAAVMYNHTNGNSTWQKRTGKLVEMGMSRFFPDNIATEQPCEGIEACTASMHYYKGLLSLSYAAAAQVAPYMADKIMPVVKDSAAAAVKTCIGGKNDRACGFIWDGGKYDGDDGAATQMSALNSVTVLLAGSARAPATQSSSDKSKDDNNGKDNKDGKESNDGKSSDDEPEDSASGKIAAWSSGSAAVVAAAFVGMLV